MSVNDALMELLITCYACKTSSARKIIGVVPYLPYSKQSKMRNRGSIPSRLIADLLCGAGTCGRASGFFFICILSTLLMDRLHYRQNFQKY